LTQGGLREGRAYSRKTIVKPNTDPRAERAMVGMSASFRRERRKEGEGEGEVGMVRGGGES